MPARALSRLLIAGTIAFFAPAWTSSTTSAQTRSARIVLTIHWGPEDFPGTRDLDAAIQEVLGSSATPPISYYAEYLESEDFPSAAASLAFRDYLRKKFEDRRIDVVIANTTPALQFALRHRDELFAGAPIVFVAGSTPETTDPRTFAGVTGVLNDVPFADTLELALRLHPSARRVFVVAQAPTAEGYDERVRVAVRRVSQRVELTFIRERSVPQLLAAIKDLPAQSLIFYTRYTPESVQDPPYPHEVVRLMAQASPVPIYAANDNYLGTGVVGGMMKGSRAIGARVAEIARQILDGTRPEDIPIGVVPVVPTFDWRQVQRWGIDPTLLPTGSDIRFRTPTAWESYGGYFIAAIVVIAAQLLLIATFLTQRARRRRAEETIRANEATLRTSYERIRHLAGRLMNAQEVARAALARDLHDGVCQELAGVSMTVGSIKSSSGNIQDAHTQEALANLEDETLRVYESVRRLSHDLHPATLRLLGLPKALKAHCSEVAARHGVQVTFETQDNLGDLHPDTAVSLFRVAQEALRNAVEHGEARHLAVSLTRSAEQIELVVTDDGRGFDLEAVRRDGHGLGLVSIEERARAIGGDMEIVTGLQAGTTIRLRCSPGTGAPLGPQFEGHSS